MAQTRPSPTLSRGFTRLASAVFSHHTRSVGRGIGDGGGFPPTCHIGTPRVQAQGSDDRKPLAVNGLLVLEAAGVEPVRACFGN